jgi:hypothetical protein
MIVLLSFCTSRNKHSLVIENNSSYRIDSVTVRSSIIQLHFLSIENNKTGIQEFVITKAIDYEGSFGATIYIPDTVLYFPSFGYYSNSRDVKKQMVITIDKNLVVKEKP